MKPKRKISKSLRKTAHRSRWLKSHQPFRADWFLLITSRHIQTRMIHTLAVSQFSTACTYKRWWRKRRRSENKKRILTAENSYFEEIYKRILFTTKRAKRRKRRMKVNGWAIDQVPGPGRSSSTTTTTKMPTQHSRAQLNRPRRAQQQHTKNECQSQRASVNDTDLK